MLSLPEHHIPTISGAYQTNPGESTSHEWFSHPWVERGEPTEFMTLPANILTGHLLSKFKSFTKLKTTRPFGDSSPLPPIIPGTSRWRHCLMQPQNDAPLLPWPKHGHPRLWFPTLCPRHSDPVLWRHQRAPARTSRADWLGVSPSRGPSQQNWDVKPTRIGYSFSPCFNVLCYYINMCSIMLWQLNNGAHDLPHHWTQWGSSCIVRWCPLMTDLSDTVWYPHPKSRWIKTLFPLENGHFPIVPMMLFVDVLQAAGHKKLTATTSQSFFATRRPFWKYTFSDLRIWASWRLRNMCVCIYIYIFGLISISPYLECYIQHIHPYSMEIPFWELVLVDW